MMPSIVSVTGKRLQLRSEIGLAEIKIECGPRRRDIERDILRNMSKVKEQEGIGVEQECEGPKAALGPPTLRSCSGIRKDGVGGVGSR